MQATHFGASFSAPLPPRAVTRTPMPTIPSRMPAGWVPLMAPAPRWDLLPRLALSPPAPTVPAAPPVPQIAPPPIAEPPIVRPRRVAPLLGG